MKTIQLALAASLAALAVPALAAGTTAGDTPTPAQEREQVRAQVHRDVTHQGGVSEQEASELDGEVSQHAAHAGYGPAMRDAIHAALAETPPCKGECLADRIHAINHAMDQGKSPDDAAKSATKTAHASGKPADPQARSADHRRDAARRDAAADRVHDRTQDRGHAAAHTGGAGGHR